MKSNKSLILIIALAVIAVITVSILVINRDNASPEDEANNDDTTTQTGAEPSANQVADQTDNSTNPPN